jgi:signal recognition particle GTPase
MSERIQDRIVEYAESAPSKAFDAARKRGGGFGDAIAAMRLKKQQMDKDDAFADNARRLIKLPKFTMAEFRDMLQDSLDKQEAGMTYITKARLKLDTMRGGSTETMIEAQKAKVQTQIDIINQMTPCEVDRPALIGYRERERISQALGLEIDRGGSRTPIGELLEQQEMMAMQRQWTIREVLQGREVPMSNEEARIRMGNYPTKWYVKLMRRMQIKTMTFKERRKLFMFNGKRNKQGKFTGHWK